MRKPIVLTSLAALCALLVGAALAPFGGLQAANTVGSDAPASFVIQLSRNGAEFAYFSNVDGLSPANPLPGPKTAGKVHLTRGLSSSRDVWDWRLQMLSGDPAAKGEVTIVVLDNTLSVLARWTLADAYPEAVIDSVKDGVGYEELVIAHNGLTLAP